MRVGQAIGEKHKKNNQIKQIYIRADYVRILKKSAAGQDRRMQDLANEAIKQYLEENEIGY